MRILNSGILSPNSSDFLFIIKIKNAIIPPENEPLNEVIFVNEKNSLKIWMTIKIIIGMIVDLNHAFFVEQFVSKS